MVCGFSGPLPKQHTIFFIPGEVGLLLKSGFGFFFVFLLCGFLGFLFCFFFKREKNKG